MSYKKTTKLMLNYFIIDNKKEDMMTENEYLQ